MSSYSLLPCRHAAVLHIHIYILVYNLIGHFAYSVKLWCCNLISNILKLLTWDCVLYSIFSTCIKNVCTIRLDIWPHDTAGLSWFFLMFTIICNVIKYSLCLCILIEVETVEKCTSMLSWLYSWLFFCCTFITAELWIFYKTVFYLAAKHMLISLPSIWSTWWNAYVLRKPCLFAMCKWLIHFVS